MSTESESSVAKTNLRKQMRARRARLTRQQQSQAARAMVRQMKRCIPAWFRGRWALYLSHQGEIDTEPLVCALRQLNREIFFPVLHPIYYNRLLFAKSEHTGRKGMATNRYGIREPSLRNARTSPAWAINVICVPLVAFDRSGNRLGMGGGYYDRSLAGNRIKIHRPLLVGMAHSFQEVDKLPVDSWDISLHAIVTDKGITHCRKIRQQTL